MHNVLIERDASPMKLEVLGVEDWEVCIEEPAVGVARNYSACETTFIINGAAEINGDGDDGNGGEVINIGGGDLVTFLPDARCVWTIIERMERYVRVG